MIEYVVWARKPETPAYMEDFAASFKKHVDAVIYAGIIV